MFRFRDKTQFTTQYDLLNKLGITNTIGLCSPLANVYLSSKMSGKNTDFLKQSDEQIYQQAMQMQMHQDNVAEEIRGEFGALVGLNVAFFDNKILFKGSKVPVDTLANSSTLKQQLGASEYALVTYPTQTEGPEPTKDDPFHQVAFNRTGPGYNKCSLFNANMTGGERVGNCDTIIEIMAKDIKNTAAKDGRPCLVAQSIASEASENTPKL